MTFKLRPEGIRHTGGWGEHCCLGQECVLEVRRRPVWLEGTIPLRGGDGGGGGHGTGGSRRGVVNAACPNIAPKLQVLNNLRG